MERGAKVRDITDPEEQRAWLLEEIRKECEMAVRQRGSPAAHVRRGVIDGYARVGWYFGLLDLGLLNDLVGQYLNPDEFPDLPGLEDEG